MEKFTVLTGIAAPLLEDDINTDQIAPVHRDFHPDHAKLLFARRRAAPDFVLNRPQFAVTRILVTGGNFGCGSSREGAVWAMAAVGIRCIIARSFAEIYRENCLKNGILPIALADDAWQALAQQVVASDGAQPITVDLRARTIAAPDGAVFDFEIADSDRMMLLEGLDEIGLTLQQADAVAEWERRTASAAPWLQRPERHGGAVPR